MDFYVEYKRKKFCIEYHGEQHYRAIDFWGGEEGLKEIQLRDKIKRDYCEKKKINYIELPYWLSFDQIHELLCQHFNNGNLSMILY